MSVLGSIHGDGAFDALPLPTVVLDTSFTIRAVNRAYVEAVQRSADELVSRPLFVCFPDNPEDPEADGSTNMACSFERVARSRRPHHMLVQRYDVCGRDGTWQFKVWSPVNNAIVEDDRVVGFVNQVQDITPVPGDISAVLLGYRDELLAATRGEPATDRLTEHVTALAARITENDALVREVSNLRRALTSRAAIEQAKGILMAERRCSPQEAFSLLAKLSQDTNVRVADVALALVYSAHREGPDGFEGTRR